MDSNFRSRARRNREILLSRRSSTDLVWLRRAGKGQHQPFSLAALARAPRAAHAAPSSFSALGENVSTTTGALRKNGPFSVKAYHFKSNHRFLGAALF